jgi:zinc protease
MRRGNGTRRDFRGRVMKAIGIGVVMLAVLAVDARAAQDWPSEGPPAPLAARRVPFPPYALKTLTNGLQVLYVPYHEQPAVSYRLLVRAGAVQEPADRPGVANFVSALLTQGTTTRSAKQIANTIDSAGGFLNATSGNELTSIFGAVIKDQTDVALALVSDIAQHPAFAEDEISLQRRQALSALQVGYDDPEYLAGAVFDRLVFGLHPYGRPNEGTPDSVAVVTRADLTAYHQRWFAPNNALLAIVGDLTEEEAFAAAEKAFGSWARRTLPEFTLTGLPVPARRVVIVDRPGSAQTEIRVGHIAIPRTHPDYIPFDMAIRILGGEGANRLFAVLRSDRGLTYGASADLHTFKVTGEVVAETDTRSAATGETLRLMVDEFTRLQREPVNPAELRGAQDFMAGNFPLSIESSSAIAEQVLSRLFYGQNLDEIKTYLDRVREVTPADIQRVSRQLLKPDQLSIVLVGDAATFIDQLRRVGFTQYDRIPLAELDLDSPTLRHPSGSRLPPA